MNSTTRVPMLFVTLTATVVAVVSCEKPGADEPDICQAVLDCALGADDCLERHDLYAITAACYDEFGPNAPECDDERAAQDDVSLAKQTCEQGCVGSYRDPEDHSGPSSPGHEAAYVGYLAALTCNDIAYFGADLSMYLSGDALALHQELCDAGCD